MLQILEPPWTLQGQVAQDQQAPAFADDVEGAGNGAIEIGVSGHGADMVLDTPH
jgi:hypothetical protein